MKKDFKMALNPDGVFKQLAFRVSINAASCIGIVGNKHSIYEKLK